MTFENTLKDALSSARAALGAVRDVLVAQAAREIVETAAGFAPEEEDFQEAIHADGPDGIHALIAVEDSLAAILADHPVAVDAMRSSIEWPAEERAHDVSRAAYAVVNESLEQAKALWSERPAVERGMGPR